MYASFNDIKGFALIGGDSDIGTLEDIYLDDRNWGVAYMVIETGGWFSSNKVLINTEKLTGIDFQARRLISDLTTDTIENAPPVGTRRPVSAQRKHDWMLRAGHHVYLAGARGAVLPPALHEYGISADAVLGEEKEEEFSEEERHLRSANELTGYSVRASDGALGSVSDLIIDPAKWKLAYFAIDTGNWLPGQLVIIAPDWAGDISWADSTVNVSHTVKEIEESPPLSKLSDLQKSYEGELYAYYGYPVI